MLEVIKEFIINSILVIAAILAILFLFMSSKLGQDFTEGFKDGWNWMDKRMEKKKNNKKDKQD